jgi:hypothetical protein
MVNYQFKVKDWPGGAVYLEMGKKMTESILKKRTPTDRKILDLSILMS